MPRITKAAYERLHKAADDLEDMEQWQLAANVRNCADTARARDVQEYEIDDDEEEDEG